MVRLIAETPVLLTDDEDFVRQFLATPYDNPMTADEAKQMIRESHHFEERNLKPLYFAQSIT